MSKKYTLYKPDIIRSVKRTLPEYNKKDIEKIINQYNEEIIKALVEDHDVIITNFGKFDINEVERYFHYNNLTDELIAKTISYRKITFSASKKLKNKINKKDDK